MIPDEEFERRERRAISEGEEPDRKEAVELLRQCDAALVLGVKVDADRPLAYMPVGAFFGDEITAQFLWMELPKQARESRARIEEMLRESGVIMLDERTSNDSEAGKT